MFRITRRNLARTCIVAATIAAAAVVLHSTDRAAVGAAKAPPEQITFSIRSYDDHVVTNESNVPYDFGTVDGSKIMYFEVRNISNTIARDFKIEFSGTQVPAVFEGEFSFASVINPGGVYVGHIRFHPPAGDATGTNYGGAEALASVKVTARKAVPLTMIVKGQKQ